MTIQVMYAHLGLLEPGTAAVDRDGDVWCVWPDGSVGQTKPITLAQDSADVAAAVTVLFGPFSVLAAGLTRRDCNKIALCSRRDGRGAARAYALLCSGQTPETGPLAPELGVESIDGSNGLRTLMGGEA